VSGSVRSGRADRSDGEFVTFQVRRAALYVLIASGVAFAVVWLVSMAVRASGLVPDAVYLAFNFLGYAGALALLVTAGLLYIAPPRLIHSIRSTWLRVGNWLRRVGR
jgi:hypothetical protein